MRIALGIEYDGSHYFGWQRQPHAKSVQQTIEDALSIVADTPVHVHAAGRTDTAVHATEQVIHFDTSVARDTKAWVMGTNTNLRSSISVLWAKQVDEEFHARFSAIGRRYRYVVLNRATRPALLDKKVCWIYKPLNHNSMSKAAECLVGKHDFSSYRALNCQAKSSIRTVYDLAVTRKDEFILIDIHADGFLHHMVRNIAGVLIEIGTEEQGVGWSKEILDQRDRTRGGVTAKASGLYLVKVHYDEAFGFNDIIRWPVFMM